jgi:hypothetical protein
MRLSLVLNDKGFILPRNENREWPDIVLTKENKKYFIEAVAANNESKQKHKKKNGVVVGSVNEDLVQSRITGSIRDKLEQFKNHNKGNFDYPFIIALNVGSVNESNTDDYVIKTAFGLGCQYIEFDKKSGEKVDGGYTKKNFITKSNGAILDSDLFEIEEYKVVSAIIYSRKNILNEFSLNCDDINIIYNPNAKIKITDSHFQCFEK